MRWILPVFVAPFLAACIPDIMNTKPEVRGLEGAAPVQTLTDPASGTDVRMRVGNTLVLKLDSNATTGYQWVVLEQDAGKLELVSEDYATDPHPPGMVGVGGHQQFVFKALVTGKSALVLRYQRSNEDVAETLSLNVTTGQP